MVREIWGRKIGMTQVFSQQGELVPVTLIEVGPCRILETNKVNNKEKVVIGYKEVQKHRQKKKPQEGYFKKLNQPYFKYIKESEKLKGAELTCGQDLGAEIFSENEIVDIRGVSIGRGFQGGMKRHNWSGQPVSHGSMTHRRIGSAGASTYPGRIVKGHPMPGHLESKRVTIKNLKVLKVDKERNLVFIKGSCPGSKNSLVIIRKKNGVSSTK